MGWWLLTAALVPAFAYAAPASSWDDPLLIVTLYALAILADRSDVSLPSGVRFDATIALMLICVALAGPLPALGVYLAPALANGITGRERLLRIGTVGNFASTGWQAITAALLMAGGSALAVPAIGLLLAGAALFYVGWAIAPLIWGTIWLGVPLRGMVDALNDMRLAAGVMVGLGAITAGTYPAFELLSLALFAVVAVLPQSALTYAARARPVARLDPLTASRRYAHAIGLQLRLSRRERQHVDAVIRTANARGMTGDPGEHLGHTVVDWSEVSCAAGHVTEWWNGAGGPAGLPGRLIPLPSRIAAVAHTWASLTADGSPQLGHHEAFALLESAAGIRLDPAVVRAAHAVLGQERLSDAIPAPEPRLHHLRVPAALRRTLAAG